jgi:hypothetical protein
METPRGLEYSYYYHSWDSGSKMRRWLKREGKRAERRYGKEVVREVREG